MTKAEKIAIVVTVVLVITGSAIVINMSGSKTESTSELPGAYNPKSPEPSPATSPDEKKELSPAATPDDPNVKYLEIEKLGIKIPVGAGTKGLTYELMPKRVLRVRSAQLDAISGECVTNSIDIQYGKSTDDFYPEIGDPVPMSSAYKEQSTGDKATNTRDIGFKIGDTYYVVTGYAGTSCVTEDKLSAESEAMLNIVNSVRKAKAI